MTRSVSYTLILLVLLASAYLGWRLTQPELAGHWHVVQSLGTDDNPFMEINHLDVYANGEVRLNDSPHRRFVRTGTVDKRLRQMNLGGECWYVHANYETSGNKMSLYGTHGGDQPWRAVAVKTAKNDCDPERDHFAGLPFVLRLPARPAEELKPLPEFSYMDEVVVHIGPARGRWSSPFVIVGVGVGSAEDLSAYVDRLSFMHPEKNDANLRLVVYQDEKANADEVLEMLRAEFAGRRGGAGYYRVFRPEGVTELEFGVRWVAW